jgi:hypothetical protein
MFRSPFRLPGHTYDAEGKLTAAGGSPSAGGTSYSYDGEGRRVEKVVGSVVTVYVYDAGGWASVEEWIDELQREGIDSLRSREKSPLSGSRVSFY